MPPVLTPGKFVELLELARRIHVSDPVLDYIQSLVAASRSDTRLKAGLSPRAALSMLQTARTHALVRQQNFCLPDNVQSVFPALAGHRLQTAGIAEVSGDRIAAELLESTPVPCWPNSPSSQGCAPGCLTPGSNGASVRLCH